ncbi:hypothetical protein GGR28_003726 [Lewinella aquimaris]|uniref:Uncharacterized protein n=1 Tax=Neolewinella aquimaris TaxID=1835722 RepID=A0A840EGZ6_9BACT|nr:hypothetical protein [Neolewinella aquimaris]MBB4081079.1 hypothetical protein [Neolewinella aquimaris]
MHTKDWLLGKKIRYAHQQLGVMTAHVSSAAPTAACTWFGKYQCPRQRIPTDLILEGTAAGPYRSQLAAVGRIIDSVDDIKYDLRRQIARQPGRHPEIRPGDWDGELAFITNNDLDTATFELTFEWGEPPCLRSISFVWSAGKVCDIRTV